MQRHLLAKVQATADAQERYALKSYDSPHHPANSDEEGDKDYIFRDFEVVGPRPVNGLAKEGEGIEEGTGPGGDGKDDITVSTNRLNKLNKNKDKAQRVGRGSKSRKGRGNSKGKRRLLTDYERHDPRLRKNTVAVIPFNLRPASLYLSGDHAFQRNIRLLYVLMLS